MAGLLGNLVDYAGTRLNLPEMGISEFLGGGPTTNTYNYQAARGNVAGPVAPSYYQQSGTQPLVLGAQTSSNFTPSTNMYSTSTGNNPQQIFPNQTVSSGAAGAGITNPNDAAGWDAANRADIQRSIDAANQASQAENQRLNTQFDYSRAQAEGQLGTLGRQRGESIGQIDLGIGDVQRQVGTSKTNLQTNTQSQINQAGSTARSVQGQNRNILRALGILNSSAAGQILAKPLNQFDEQRAQLGQFLVQKTTELDDFVNQKVSEASQLKASIVGNYDDLVGKIQTDMRFNERQRNDALSQANAALSQHLSDIALSVQNYQQQAQMQKQQFQASMAQALNYQNPTYNAQAQGYQPLVNPTQGVQSANIYQDPNKKRLG